MTARRLLILFIALLPLFFPRVAQADTPPVCTDITNRVLTGGVTRSERFDVDIPIDLPITQYYCGQGAPNALNPAGADGNAANPTKPTLDQIESDPCTATGKTVEQNRAECLADQNTRSPACACVYWIDSGSNCPVTKDTTAANNQARDTMRQKILNAVKEKLAERYLVAGTNTNTNVKNESQLHEKTLTELRTPAQASSVDFVNSTVGETAKAKSNNKIYYAGCFNLDFSELGLPPETGWFTMVKESVALPIEGVVPPSFKKEATITDSLQNSVTQIPGPDPVVKFLTEQEPQFSSDTEGQKDFPKIELKLASKKVDGSKNKYLIYWKMCTAKGVADCEISNFITDIENVATKQEVVATTPTDLWGWNTSDPATGAYQCFTTGDNGTSPLEVTSDSGDYYSFRAKIVGQSTDEVQKVAAPHCQNSAEVLASVPLDSSGRIAYSGGNFAAVAYCPENDYVAPTGQDTPVKTDLCILGSCHLSVITRLFNDAKDKIFSVFEKHVQVEDPPAMRQSCEAITDRLCGPYTSSSVASSKLAVSHTVTPSQITPAPGNTAVPVSVELRVVNNSNEDATNVDVISIWSDGINVANIKKDDGTDVPGHQVSWHIDRIPGNNTDNNVTTLSYTATVDATSQTVYRLQDLIYADVTTEHTLTARETKVPFVAGTATPTTPIIADDGGLQIRESIASSSASLDPINMKLDTVDVTVRNTSPNTINNAVARSTWSPASGVIVNSDGGTGSSFATGGMSWQLGDILAGEQINFSYSLYFNLATNQLFSGTAEVTGTSTFTSREFYTKADAPIRVGQASSLCEKIAWMICYFTNIQSFLTGPQNNYHKTITVHTYPYSDVAYTQNLQSDLMSGANGYFNAFTPPTDEFANTDTEQRLSTRDSAANYYPSKTLVMGANQDNNGVNKLFTYFTPPGQTPPNPITTSTEDNNSPVAPSPMPTPQPPPASQQGPNGNQAFSIAACGNLSVPVKSDYTQGILEQAAASQGVPVNLLAAVLFAEHRGGYTATGPDPTCNPNVCAAYGWFQITCGAENVVCEVQNPASHCSNFYCCDTNGDGVKDSVCNEYKGWFSCPAGATAADLCNPASAAVLAAQKLKGKIGVGSNHVWTNEDVCNAAARYFGASGNCDTSGGSYASLGGCTYGHYAREFVMQAGL